MDEQSGCERRARKDMQRNLERVLRAAHELFAERGPDVTMEEVARRAGVGVGTIYRRFPSKDHLFAAVSSAVCADTQHMLSCAAEEASDPVGKLRALVITQYRRSEQQAALMEMRPALAESRPAYGPDGEGLYTALHHMLAQAISEGQRAGAIRPGDADALAALCLELLSPRSFQRLRLVVGGPADDVAEHALRFVLGGLGACADS
jgi:AcrR family transcriptional regulator